MLAFLVATVLLATAACAQNLYPTLTDVPASVNPATNRLVDEYGREVYFHGANVVVKSPPWIPETSAWTPETSFSHRDMAMMQSLGLNGIRLGTMWPGVEPSRGHYNHTYVAALFNLVRTASTYGVYSLLDMHQDVLSEKFCGEGVPLWAAQANTTNFPYPASTTPYNVSAQGIPSYDECHSKSWPAYYFTTAAGQAFQNLYTNFDGLRDAWVNFWAFVARSMSPLQSAVLGFELINEPWAGDAVQAPELLIPGVADLLFLQPMYAQAAAAIRRYDTSHAIFFEPVTWDDFGCGFTEVPGGAAWRNLSVLSYHFYIPPDFSIAFQFAERAKDIKRLGSGGFLTEFSVRGCAGCGNVEPVAVMDACDEYLQSWLFWEWKPFVGPKTGHSNSVWFSNGTLNLGVIRNVSRTYAQIVAGITQRMRFHTESSKFELDFLVSASVRSNVTQIYLNEEYHYPSGFNVTIAPAGAATWQKVARNTVHVTTNAVAAPGSLVSVRIVPS